MIDFDAWRGAYPSMTFADQREFYDRCFAEYPVQCHHNSQALGDFLEIVDPGSVVELGGWTGQLAAEILPSHPGILSWENYDIAADALAHPAPLGPRYQPVLLTDWFWTLDLSADLFVASHVIEHLSDEHWAALLPKLHDYHALFLAAPLDYPSRDQGWRGYLGSHILSLGWDQIVEQLDEFEVIMERPDVKCFLRA